MHKIGSKQNLIKELMRVLGEAVVPTRIDEALRLLNDIKKYDFKYKVSVYFYYDEIIDDFICLTENKDEVDWDAELVVEIIKDTTGFYARVSGL